MRRIRRQFLMSVQTRLSDQMTIGPEDYAGRFSFRVTRSAAIIRATMPSIRFPDLPRSGLHGLIFPARPTLYAVLGRHASGRPAFPCMSVCTLLCFWYGTVNNRSHT
jgi:hypothetical protein